MKSSVVTAVIVALGLASTAAAAAAADNGMHDRKASGYGKAMEKQENLKVKFEAQSGMGCLLKCNQSGSLFNNKKGYERKGRKEGRYGYDNDEDDKQHGVYSTSSYAKQQKVANLKVDIKAEMDCILVCDVDEKYLQDKSYERSEKKEDDDDYPRMKKSHGYGKKNNNGKKRQVKDSWNEVDKKKGWQDDSDDKKYEWNQEDMKDDDWNQDHDDKYNEEEKEGEEDNKPSPQQSPQTYMEDNDDDDESKPTPMPQPGYNRPQYKSNKPSKGNKNNKGNKYNEPNKPNKPDNNKPGNNKPSKSSKPSKPNKPSPMEYKPDQN